MLASVKMILCKSNKKKCIFAHINLINMHNLYIISGCNGAGKTTASYTILPELLGCREFVNADEIAKGLSLYKETLTTNSLYKQQVTI